MHTSERMALIEIINDAIPTDATEASEWVRLEAIYGPNNMWNTKELKERFEVHSFLAPFVIVIEKITKKKGVVLFQHHPRMYFDFRPDNTV